MDALFDSSDEDEAPQQPRSQEAAPAADAAPDRLRQPENDDDEGQQPAAPSDDDAAAEPLTANRCVLPPFACTCASRPLPYHANHTTALFRSPGALRKMKRRTRMARTASGGNSRGRQKWSRALLWNWRAHW